MRRLAALFAVSFLVLAFSACGGDEPLTTGRTTTTTEEDDEETTTTTEEDDEATTTTTEGGGGGASTAVCEQIEALNNAEDPESLEDLADFMEDFNGLRDQLPDDLADDLDVFNDFFIQVLAAAEANDGDIEGALNEVFENLDEDELADIEEATEALDQFGEEECGIESGDFDDESTTTTGGSGSDEELGDPSPPPDLENDEEADFAEQCFGGDLEACDSLWGMTAVDSPGEQYAESCGGRVEGPEFGTCVQNFG